MSQELLQSRELLHQKVQDFIQFFEQDMAYDFMVYELWSAKDILGHIVFWHESFAKNLKDLALGTPCTPLRGKLSEVNQRSVATTKSIPIPDLILRLKAAQKTIALHITNETIDLIPYKKGSRSYSRHEHLEVVAGHIHKHLRDLKQALKKLNSQ